MFSGGGGLQAKNVNASFLKVVASAIVDKYIGESARVIREMFGQSAAANATLHTWHIRHHSLIYELSSSRLGEPRSSPCVHGF